MLKTPALLLAGLVAVALSHTASAAAPKVGEEAPEITATKAWNNPDGKLKLSDFRGEYVFLNMWATW